MLNIAIAEILPFLKEANITLFDVKYFFSFVNETEKEEGMKDFPSKGGNLAWDELEILAKSLGYHRFFFQEGLAYLKTEHSFVQREDLQAALEGKALLPLLEKTYNNHDGSYNVKVISKSIELLTQRYLTFSKLRTARLAYQTYEHTDNTGLEEKNILPALRLCDRIMSPMKLCQMLRHMNRLVSDRLMFYEFLDVLASAEEISTVTNELPKKQNLSKQLDERNLFPICNFEDELSTFDERCRAYLDRQFEESLKIIQVKNTSTSPDSKDKQITEFVKPPLVNTSVRQAMAGSAKSTKYQELLRGVEKSDERVKFSKGVGTCQCCNNKEHADDQSAQSFENDKLLGYHSSTKTKIPIEKYHYEVIVTVQDILETERKLQQVGWDIATHKQQLRRRIQCRDIPKVR